MITLSTRSRERLVGVHPHLVRVIEEAAKASTIDFCVTEGLRTAARQRELVAQGKSQTSNSRHLTGHAVDLCVLINGKADWTFSNYQKLAAIVKAAAEREGVAIVWGGDWKTLKDGPHFELDRKVYPA